jgi:ABC-2 type transport system permease protein
VSVKITLATARRILAQLMHDRRTLGMIVGVPSLLMILLRYIMNRPEAFDRFGPMLLGVFPLVVMFIVTSVATLRERTSGTLERLMTMPLGKLDLLLGYALAFAVTALVQVAVVATIALTWLGLDLRGSVWTLGLLTLLAALLGVALGLFTSAFARTEFQAVQFMPALVFPQVLLCGLLVPREDMVRALEVASYALPLTYSYDALDRVTQTDALDRLLARDIAVTVGVTLLALALGAATLRRRTE